VKRPNINAVALQAGVSKSTVSHVINHTRFVEEATRQRVLDAIRELGYRPSVIARSLTTNRTQTIGIIVSDASNQFFGELIRGIETVFGDLGYGLIVCNTDEILEREEAYINLLLSLQVDGIIAAATSQRWAALDSGEMQQQPIVFVDRRFAGMGERPFVSADNRRGANLGVSHLVECGYTDIGILAGFQRLSSMSERLEGFKDALSRHGLTIREEWMVTSVLGIEQGRAAAHQLLSLPNRPRAVFANNNFLALGALLAIGDLGLRCPEEIALVGFDDHPWAAVSHPPLTVVRQPSLEVGKRAAEALLALLHNEAPEQTVTLLECELVVRQSCGYASPATSISH
jgi:LacI family transcriptional regulator